MCTRAEARSRLLEPGEATLLDVTFNPRVDGPGEHGEVIHLEAERTDGDGEQIVRDLLFNITVLLEDGSVP